MRQLQEKKTDFPIKQTIAAWLHDLVSGNVDDVAKVGKEWHILHVTPGHLLVFLPLRSKDLSRQIQYPFKEPYYCPANRPLPSAEWTEQLYSDYWNFVVRLRGLQEKPLFSDTRVRIR